jgi:hypothetical protein
MRTNLLRGTGVAVTALAALFGTATGADATPGPGVTQVNATTLVYGGPLIRVAVSDRFARHNPESGWLMLDTAMDAINAPIAFPRDAIAVRTPDGQVVPLATQQEFAQHYRELAAAIMRANFMKRPLEYLPPERFRPLGLFAPRGIGLAWQAVWLDPFHNSYGRLYFRLPSRVQRGQYALLIHLAHYEVVIPFTI